MHFDQGVLSKHLALQVQQYVIPEFQRPYSWVMKDWKTLWVDALGQYRPNVLASSTATSPEDHAAMMASQPTHYMGTLVTADPLTVTPPRSRVIDGQQRLLTVTVALLAIRDARMKQLGDSSEAAATERQATALHFLNPGFTGEQSWRIIPQALDRPAYTHLISAARAPGLIKTETIGLQESDSRLLLQAFNYFYREARRMSLPSSAPFEVAGFADLYPLDLKVLADTFMNRLYLIKIITDSVDDANMIFESLNTKGRDLQQVDLIKNYLYLSLGAAATSTYESYWRPMELVLRPDELERYAWASLVSHGENILQKRTYEAVQRRLRTSSASDVEAYVKDLSEEAVYFERLLRPDREPELPVRGAVQRVMAAGGSTALPLVLYCYRRLRTGSADANEFVTALRLIESFLVRRMLAGAGTNNLNSMFGLMCSRLHNDDRFSPTESLVDDIGRALSYRPEDWPSDGEVKEQLLRVDFYHSQKSEQRQHVLRSLDQHFNSSGVEVNYFDSDKSIEHIAPQNEEATEWVSVVDPDQWDQMQAVVHCLANLTLLTPPDNSKASDHAWPFKHNLYTNYGYALTARLATRYDVGGGWTLDRIIDRASDLTEAIAVLWPRVLVSAHPVENSATAEPAPAATVESDEEPEELGPDVEESLLDAEIAEDQTHTVS